MAVVALNMIMEFTKQFEDDEYGECTNIKDLTLQEFHRYIMQYINIERER